MKNRLTYISKTKKVRWHKSVEDLKTSARNVEYSRGVIDKPSEILNLIDDRLDNCEAIIELLTLHIVARLKGIIPNVNDIIMKKFYFTFGFGQQYEDCYVVIESETWEGAREEMIRRYGKKWSFQYTEDEWLLKPDDPYFKSTCKFRGFDPDRKEPLTQAEMYGLTEIK